MAMCVITITDLIMSILGQKNTLLISIKFANQWGYIVLTIFVAYKLYGSPNISNKYFVKWLEGYLKKKYYSEFTIFLLSMVFDMLVALYVLSIVSLLSATYPFAFLLSISLVIIPVLRWLYLIYKFVNFSISELTFNIYYYFLIQFSFKQHPNGKFSDQLLKIIWVTVLLIIWLYLLRWSIKDFKPPTWIA